MKRAFSFRNQGQDPPIEPLQAAPDAPDKDPKIEQTDDRDLQVVPEGGRFGELLVRKQLVSRGSIMEALLQQTGTGKRLGALLVDAGAITDRQLAETLADQLQLPLADLRNDRPDPEAVAKIPEHVARELVAVPLRLDGNALQVVVADPTPETVRLLKEVTRSSR